MKADREFYEKEYHFDEDVEVIDQKRLQRFFRHVDFTKIRISLDVGCGVGWALKYCSDKGFRCIGSDISKKALDLSKKILNPEVKTVVADGEKLPFVNDRFDLVFSLGSIEHFSSPSAGLAEIRRVTKKGGQVLLVVPNSYWILNKLRLYKGTEQPQEMLATLGEWVRFIEMHQIKVVNIGKDLGPKIFKNMKPLSIIKRALLKFTLTLPLSFSYQFVFVCIRQ